MFYLMLICLSMNCQKLLFLVLVKIKIFGPESPLSDQKFSFVLFDADLYNSTKFALDFVFPRLVNGGIMVFQDYEREEKLEYSWGERQAVDEFFSLHNLKLNNDKSLTYFQLKNNENVNNNL